MAKDITVVILQSSGLTNIKDIQGNVYHVVPDKGTIVAVAPNHPEIGKKLWRPANDIIQLEEMEAALAKGVTPPPAKPAKPTGLTESGVTKTEIKLDWGQTAHASKYTVSISPAVTGYPKDVSVNRETFTGLTAATAYTIKVKACNAVGCSADTQKTVTTAS